MSNMPVRLSPYNFENRLPAPPKKLPIPPGLTMDDYADIVKREAERNGIPEKQTGPAGLWWDGMEYPLDPDATGTTPLSEEHKMMLAERYDFNNMTKTDKLNLICDLTMLNAIPGGLANYQINMLLMPEDYHFDIEAKGYDVPPERYGQTETLGTYASAIEHFYLTGRGPDPVISSHPTPLELASLERTMKWRNEQDTLVETMRTLMRFVDANSSR